jgi:DNA-binding IclR family transcriptional regulator
MPRVKPSAAPTDGILAVTLTFSIIETLARSRSALGVTELAHVVDATKSRIHRHLVTLSHAGYVTQDPRTEKYSIGSGMVALAQAIATSVDIVAIARPALTKLRDDFGHTTLIAKCEGDQVRVLDVALGTSDYAIIQRAGNFLPPNTLHCSALGKIALAFGPPELLQDVLSRRLVKITPCTITDRRALIAEIDRVRSRGWACVPDERMMGFNAIAVPIMDAQANLAAMIGVIGATRILSAKPSPELVAGIRRAGASISAASGVPLSQPSLAWTRGIADRRTEGR